MLENLTGEIFSQHLNEKFLIHFESSHPSASPSASPMEAELIEVTSLGSRPSQIRGVPFPLREEPFSMVFRSPQEPALTQSMYRIEHPQMGLIDGLFLVPIGRDAAGYYYETILN